MSERERKPTELAPPGTAGTDPGGSGILSAAGGGSSGHGGSGATAAVRSKILSRFTNRQFNQFREIISHLGDANQYNRASAAKIWQGFIKKHGPDKCQAMIDEHNRRKQKKGIKTR